MSNLKIRSRFEEKSRGKLRGRIKHRLKSILKSNSGEGYIDMAVLVIVAMLVIALAVNVYPVFIIKSELNTFANEIARIAEIEGEIGNVTNREANKLRESTGIDHSFFGQKQVKSKLAKHFT